MAYVWSEVDKRMMAHVRRICRKFDWSFYRLAKETDLDPSALYKLFSQDRGVGIDMLKAIAQKVPGESADALLFTDPAREFFDPGPDEGRRGRRRGAVKDAGPPRAPARRHGSGR